MRSKLIIFSIVTCMLLSSSVNVFATGLIKVGASVQAHGTTEGNCMHGDRVTDLYANRFIDEITYNPILGD